jgi:hypothetical protein
MGAVAHVRLLGLALLIALAGCDTRAESTPAGSVGHPDRLSREHESCGTTAHCAEGLRCFEQTCRRTDRSLLGDYHAALGAQARDSGDAEAARAAYAEAVGVYEAEGLAVPVDVECGHGVALAAGGADKERTERAARVLHRCVAAAPPGSALRASALRAAAGLHAAGLDPAHLAREQPADVYLSRAPSRPRSEDLAIEVTASPAPSAKGWPTVVEAIQGARPALVACWEAHHADRGAPTLTVGVPLRSVHRQLYDDEPAYSETRIDPRGPAAAGEAETCVRAAVAAAVEPVRGGGTFATTVTVTVK